MDTYNTEDMAASQEGSMGILRSTEADDALLLDVDLLAVISLTEILKITTPNDHPR